MGKIFAFCNQKGGVGKTTSVLNVATIVSNAGCKVLVLDMDSQGNATSGLGLEKDTVELTGYHLLLDDQNPKEIVQKTEFENLDIIPSNADLSGADLELVSMENREFVLKGRLEGIAKEYDFIFIDCPPSLGLITVNCLTASNYVIIPLQCEYYALEGLGQLLRTYQLVQSNLNEELEIGGVILTMADFRTNLTQQVIEEVKAHFKEKVFAAIIPRSVKISEAPSFGKPAVVYDPYNKASKSYVSLSVEFIKRFVGRDYIENKKADESNQPRSQKANHVEVSE